MWPLERAGLSTGTPSTQHPAPGVCVPAHVHALLWAGAAGGLDHDNGGVAGRGAQAPKGGHGTPASCRGTVVAAELFHVSPLCLPAAERPIATLAAALRDGERACRVVQVDGKIRELSMQWFMDTVLKDIDTLVSTPDVSPQMMQVLRACRAVRGASPHTASTSRVMCASLRRRAPVSAEWDV